MSSMKQEEMDLLTHSFPYISYHILEISKVNHADQLVILHALELILSKYIAKKGEYVLPKKYIWNILLFIKTILQVFIFSLSLNP